MITKQKKCKGTGKAIDSGCGNISYLHKYGLCSDCFKSWLYNTPNGQEMLSKTVIRVKKQTQLKVKQKIQVMKQGIDSKDKYRSRVLQRKINLLARLIDAGLPCICSGNFGLMNGGHYIDVNRNRTTALNLHNIHRQCYETNHHHSGDKATYRIKLISEYGEDYLNFIEGLKGMQPLNLTLQDMKDINKRALRIIKEYYPEPLTADQRIEMRNKINNELGIYGENGIFVKK